MKYPVIWKPEAERDLLDAMTWYDEQRPGLGGEFIAEVDDATLAVGIMYRRSYVQCHLLLSWRK